MSKQMSYTKQLLKQQLLLYGKIARSPEEDTLRQLTFCTGDLRPATSRYIRRVGRPRNEWAAKVHEVAIRIAGSTSRLDSFIRDDIQWKALVEVFANAP